MGRVLSFGSSAVLSLYPGHTFHPSAPPKKARPSCWRCEHEIAATEDCALTWAAPTDLILPETREKIVREGWAATYAAAVKATKSSQWTVGEMFMADLRSAVVLLENRKGRNWLQGRCGRWMVNGTRRITPILMCEGEGGME